MADKLENLNERFSSFPESSFHRLLLSDFQKQYQEIQAGLKKNITNLQNSSVFDIPDGFVKSEHEKTIVELLKAIDVRLRLIETTIYSLDDLAKSLQHIQQDLTINEIDQNLDQLETAQELFNTAILAHHKGDYAELVRLMRQAIVVFEELLGANHPDTIISHKIIAVVEEAFGRSDVK